MKKVLRFLLSKRFIFGLLIAIQTGFFFALVYKFSTAGSYLYTAVTILGVLIVLVLFERDDTNPAYKLMWVAIILLLPLAGVLFYLMWGNNNINRKILARFNNIENSVKDFMTDEENLQKPLKELDSAHYRCAQYLRENAAAPIFTNTKSTYYPWGEDFFDAFIEKIKQAKKSIYMEYFIIENGKMWDTTLEVLKEKAKEGIDIRIMYDSVGCMLTLPGNYEAILRSYGIKAFEFNPLKLSTHLSDYTFLNHRNHRKITIIDNEIAFTGGVNFADEYINHISPLGVWKDNAVMLEGDGAFGLCSIFLRMWSFVSGENVDYESYLPQNPHLEYDNSFVQPYGDSPLDNENVSENAYFNIMSTAKDYVYIASPYLIIDNEMLTMLILAAKSGVDVRIIVPGVPDKKAVFLLTQSYYPSLVNAGVRIYEYIPGFIHCKTYVSDDNTAIVGSANMDYRSLYLHFENCCAFYGGDIVSDVKADLVNTFSQCKEITKEELRKRSVFTILQQAVLRLFAPLM